MGLEEGVVSRVNTVPAVMEYETGLFTPLSPSLATTSETLVP